MVLGGAWATNRVVSLTSAILLAALTALSLTLAFLRLPPAEEVARLRRWAYRSIILIEWWLAALYLILLRADGWSWSRLGLWVDAREWQSDLLWATGVTLAALAFGELCWRLARHRGWSGRDLVEALLPRSPQEKRLALGLAVTAGCCEELLYRGFLIPALDEFFHVAVASGISVLLFALAHAPYGRLGLVSSLGGGILLAAAFLATGRLLAPVLAHIAYDCYAFFSGRLQTVENYTCTRMNTHR